MPRAHDSDIVLVDGTVDWSGGVDSIKVSTVADQQNPNGLARNQLAWASNGTVRDGGITPRAGWSRIGRVHDGSAWYQGGIMYEPDAAFPYLMLSFGGQIYRVDPNAIGSIDNLSTIFGMVNPSTPKQAFFVQAEQFCIIQAGDFETNPAPTLPLFWDNSVLRRSIGITTKTPTHTNGVNEIPAATCMDYYQNRLWYAQNRNYGAGDIAGGPSGTPGYEYRDAVLNVTENPMVLGATLAGITTGDGFEVPTNAGNIRALKHSANLDSALGQGNLYVFTRKSVYSLAVPITRTNWIAANINNAPLQTVVQLVNGSVNDRGVVAVNGDLYYQSFEPGIRSLVTAIRYFGQPGNTQIAANEERILQFVDRGLLYACSGVEFDNRLLMTTLPRETPQGVAHQALIPLDFTPLSTFESTNPPVWEGQYEGLEFLQLFTGDFGGLQRCFGLVLAKDGGVDLWELSNADRFDETDHRITMYMEFPAFTWGNITQLKNLVGGELWVDRLMGEVVFTMDYRPDGDPCWYPWHKWKICTSKSSCEDVKNPICYPITAHRESYRPDMTLPKPPTVCNPVTNRPSTEGYQFQCRLTVHGFCRIRALYLYATELVTSLYRKPIC